MTFRQAVDPASLFDLSPQPTEIMFPLRTNQIYNRTMDERLAEFDPRSGRPRKSLAQILDRFAVQPSGCWEWTGTRNAGGYGIVCLMLGGERSTMPAHRVQWMRCHGEIPDGMVVMHLCDNRACINLLHLAVATQAGNLTDMRLKGRANTSGLIKHPRLTAPERTLPKETP